MNQNPHQAIPDEEKIEKLLCQFKPQPSKRYYEQIALAPWRAGAPAAKQNKLVLRNNFLTITVGTLVIILLIILSLFVFFPSARVTADQIIHFFLPSTSNQVEIQVTPESSTTMLDFSNPANFPLSVNEARQLVKFAIREIPALPANLIFTGARYEKGYNAVIFLYTGSDYILFFTQRPAGDGQDVFSVGADAKIDWVMIGENQAEYVLGGWKASATQPAVIVKKTPATTELNAVWDNQLPQSTLRWVSDGMVYELRTSGSETPSRSEIIDWANGLK